MEIEAFVSEEEWEDMTGEGERQISLPVMGALPVTLYKTNRWGNMVKVRIDRVS